MIRRFLAMGLCVASLAACSVFGGAEGPNTAKAFAAAYTGLTAARETALTLLRTEAITPDQAEAFQAKADNVRGALDLAAGNVAVSAEDAARAAVLAPGGRIPDEPEDAQRLAVRAIAAAAELAACVDFARVDFSGCIQGATP